MNPAFLMAGLPLVIGLCLLVSHANTAAGRRDGDLRAGPGRKAPKPGTNPLPDSGVSWQAGQEAERTGDYAKALIHVENYRRTGGEPFLAALRTGRLLCRKGEPRQAYAAFSLALDMEPGAVAALLGQLEAAQAAGDHGAAARAAQELAEVPPLDREEEKAAVGGHFEARNFREALLGARKFLRYDPEDLAARSWEAWALFRLGRGWEGLIAFDTLIGLHPDFPHARLGFEFCSGLARETENVPVTAEAVAKRRKASFTPPPL